MAWPICPDRSRNSSPCQAPAAGPSPERQPPTVISRRDPVAGQIGGMPLSMPSVDQVRDRAGGAVLDHDDHDQQPDHPLVRAQQLAEQLRESVRSRTAVASRTAPVEVVVEDSPPRLLGATPRRCPASCVPDRWSCRGRSVALVVTSHLLDRRLCGQQVAGTPGPSRAAPGACRRAVIVPSGQQRHPVGEQHGRRAVRDHDAGGAGSTRAAPPRPAPRCARPARTACRRARGPPAGRGPRGPARAAAADRRTGTCPARRSGSSRPQGRSYDELGLGDVSASRISASVASGRPRVRFSRTLIENSVGSSNAVATDGPQLRTAAGPARRAVDGDPARRSRRTAGGPER